MKAEAIASQKRRILDVDIIVNVQGDEPFVKKEPLQKLLDVFKGRGEKSAGGFAHAGIERTEIY